MVKTYPIYVLIFFILLLMPVWASIIGYEAPLPERFEELRKEQRIPYKPPEWNASGIVDYLDHTDQWFTDNLGFRYEMIELNSRLFRSVAASPDPQKVIFGKNDFLFAGDNLVDVVSKSTGRIKLEPDELNKYFQHLLEVKEHFDRETNKFYIVIAPNKHTVYYDYLPNYLQKYSGVSTMYDQVHGIINGRLEIIDVRKALVNARVEYNDLLYHKTDTHWTTIGAYVAYCRIIEYLQQFHPELDLLEIENYTCDSIHAGFDLAYKMNLLNEVKDHNIQLYIKNKLKSLVAYTLEGERIKLNPDQFVANKEDCIVESNVNDLTLLLIKDSFSTKLSFLLNQTFGKVVYVHFRSLSGKYSPEQLLDEYEPDIVLWEFVERYLGRKIVNPDEWSNHKLFENSEIFYEFNGNEVLNQLTRLPKIKIIDSNKNGLVFINGSSSFSRFYFKQLTLPRADKWYFCYEIYAPENTSAFLFYTTPENPVYSDKTVIKHVLAKGWNNVVLPIDSPILDGKFRLDPGLMQGKYSIRKVQLRALL